MTGMIDIIRREGASGRRSRRLILPILLAFFSIIVLSSPAAAGSVCGNPSTPFPSPFSITLSQGYYQCVISQSWNGLMPLAVVAVLIAFTIAAIIFMLGTAFKSDRIRNFGIGELYEAVATALIVGMFITISNMLVYVPSAILNTASTTSFSNPALLSVATTDPFTFTLTSLSILTTDVETIYNELFNGPFLGESIYNINQPPGSGPNYWYTVHPNCYGPICGYINVHPLITIDYSVEAVEGISLSNLISALDRWNPIGPLLQLTVSQTVLLPDIGAAGFMIDALYVLWSEFYLILFFAFIGPLLVAAGAIFRAFIPTRAFGGMLIALGVGFYLVMPTLFAFMFTVLPPSCAQANLGACGQISTNLYTSIVTSSITSALDPLWLYILFYPLFAISLTYVFVTQFGNLIGATAQMGGRLRAGFI